MEWVPWVSRGVWPGCSERSGEGRRPLEDQAAIISGDWRLGSRPLEPGQEAGRSGTQRQVRTSIWVTQACPQRVSCGLSWGGTGPSAGLEAVPLQVSGPYIKLVWSHGPRVQPEVWGPHAGPVPPHKGSAITDSE